ncbi:MAG: efflux RND transporter periplasmic adaptor subunit [Deltaproteobacteria bacterium]|nr:efflux RND transporter periplasmic adaptor subunit [Deltaproteobacteria bacterium]
MNKLISLLGWMTFAALGAGIIIIADWQGWLPGSGQKQVASSCRHELNVKTCPFCNPKLTAKMGICPDHGVPEALCSRCNPALIPGFKADSDWCAGHAVPESQCTQCNPQLLTAGAVEVPMTPVAASGQYTPAEDLPRSRRSADPACKKHELRVQFPSSATSKNAGIEFARAERRKVSHSISCNAEIMYDGNRYARLSSRAEGVVSRVIKDLGDPVAAGEVLAVVDSAELGTAKAEYLQAQARVSLWERNHKREQVLLKKRVSTERELLEAETRLVESRISLSRAAQRLKNLGLSESDIAELEKNRSPSSLLDLAAPFAGIIVERAAVMGEVAGTAKELFAIADTSRMWALLDVYEDDLGYVRTGQSVSITVEGSRSVPREGIITWISTHVDNRTRTLKARVELANPDGMLRAGMFSTALVNIWGPGPAIVVPKSAVQWEGCCNIVFVKKSDVQFEPRKVRLGFDTGSWFVVEAGLAAGERVVTTGSFLLKTELLKGSIGAGCCEIEPGKS